MDNHSGILESLTASEVVLITSPVNCLSVAVGGVSQVVDGDEEDGEADEAAGHNDCAQHGLDLGRGEGRQRGHRHVLRRRDHRCRSHF